MSRPNVRRVRSFRQNAASKASKPPTPGRVTIITFLAEQQQAYVAGLFMNDKEVLAAHSWEELRTIVTRKSVTLLIFSLAADESANVDSAAEFMERYPSVPVIVYATLDHVSIRAIIDLSHRGLLSIVLEGFDDSPERFRALVNQVRANPFGAPALSGLQRKLTALPVRLARAIEELFQMPHRFVRAHDLASAAGISLAALYRGLATVQLGSPRRLIVAAKLMQGIGYLEDPGLSVTEVARKLGYTRSRIFCQHSVEVLGVTPSRIRIKLSPEAANGRFRAWLDA